MEDEELDDKENEDEEDLEEGAEDASSGPSVPGKLYGTQPIDAVITEHGMKNHDVMQMNRGGLTHKHIAKARKGRRLTPKIQRRITEALNAALKQRGVAREYRTEELFNY